MVRATQGILIQGDVALIEFIRALDDQQPSEDKFVLGGDVGDGCIFVKDKKIEWVQQKVAEWQQSLRYEPKPGQ